MEPLELVKTIVKCMDDKKARDICVLNVADLTSVADYFVICTGGSTPQINAIYDEIDERLSQKGLMPRGREGAGGAYWVLMDYGDAIVHIFNDESREFYNIENLWADAEKLDVSKLL